jgi:hypothetical protein
VFLFAYSHSNQPEKDKQSSFFDIEGNPAKMLAMPAGARIFLGEAIRSVQNATALNLFRDDLLAHGAEDYYQINRSWNRAIPDYWRRGLNSRLFVTFPTDRDHLSLGSRSEALYGIKWEANGPGTGRFTFSGAKAKVFVGFGAGDFNLESPFASLMLVPADPSKTFKDADRLLLTALARTQNPGMAWNEQGNSVSTNWGKAPPQIEVVKGTIKLDEDYTVRALDSSGKVLKEYATEDRVMRLGEARTVWYELVRK